MVEFWPYINRPCAGEILRIKAQGVFHPRQHEFPVCGRQCTQAHGRNQNRREDPQRRDAGGRKCRHFSMALQPGDRKHGRNQRQQTANPVEEGDRSQAVIAADDNRQAPLLVGKFDEGALSYPWVHPDPRVDRLHGDLLHLVQESQEKNEARHVTFDKVWEMAVEAQEAVVNGSRKLFALNGALAQKPVPFLSEPWYC